MANPLFLFFATRAGWAATVLRLTVAAFLLYHSIGEIRLLLGSETGLDTGVVFNWMRISAESNWGGVILNCTFGVGLFLGFFTRFFSFALLVFLLFGIFSHPVAGNDWIREAILFASLSLAVMIAGGGALSVDRKISEYLLPTIG